MQSSGAMREGVKRTGVRLSGSRWSHWVVAAVIVLGAGAGASLLMGALGNGGASATTPQSAASQAAEDLQNGNPSALCSVARSSDESICTQAADKLSTYLTSHHVAVRSVTVSDVRTQGSHATAALRMKICAPSGSCVTTTSPATFVEERGHWYLDQNTFATGEAQTCAGTGSCYSTVTATSPGTALATGTSIVGETVTASGTTARSTTVIVTGTGTGTSGTLTASGTWTDPGASTSSSTYSYSGT